MNCKEVREVKSSDTNDRKIVHWRGNVYAEFQSPICMTFAIWGS